MLHLNIYSLRLIYNVISAFITFLHFSLEDISPDIEIQRSSCFVTSIWAYFEFLSIAYYILLFLCMTSDYAQNTFLL
jgi:hypothetical protein